MEFNNLLSYKTLQTLDPGLFTQVTTVYNMVKETINNIAGCFNNYTMHDIGHSVRVAHYMEQLAFGIDGQQENRIKEFNAAELTILLLSALLHDIGMFIRSIDKEEITKGIIKHADKLKITYKGVLEVKNGNIDETIKEIIRLTHAARVFEFLDHEFEGHQKIAQILKIDGNYDYSNDIGLVCQAHGEDYNFIKTQLRSSITKGIYEYNLQYFAVLLRIADYLDLDKQRTPMLWFSMMDIEGYSKGEWENHFQISNEKKLKQYDDKMQIYFDGSSSDAKIHRKYLKYIDNLREEIENADILLNGKDVLPKYRLNLTTRIDDSVQTNGFKYSDLRLSLDYAAITDLLMGKNIYGDNRLGLRELIQNAIDACKIIREIDIAADERPETRISVIISEKNNYVKIRDTGIGMTLDVIKNHFLNIGKSYYKSNEYLYNNYRYKPIGQYGIGFLACFLLSDNVVVKTKCYDSNDVYQIGLEKNSEYVVTNTENSPMFTGTEIKLDYKQFFRFFKNTDKLKNFIEEYFDTDIPISIKDEDKNISVDTKNKILRNIDNVIERYKTQNVERIDINQYTDKATGVLFLVPAQKKYSYCLKNFDCDEIFLYDKEKKRFEPVKNLENKFYTEIPYVKIEEDEYLKIAKSRREDENKIKAILAAGKNEKTCIKLYVDCEERFPYRPYFWEDDSERLKELKQVIDSSSLPFYVELLGRENRNIVYCFNNKIIEISSIDFLNESFYPRFYLETRKKEPANLYYKNILVKDFRSISAQLPYDYEIFGLIDYLGDDLKLDVSRNEIIGGYNKLSYEFNSILLKYFISKEQTAEKKELLKSILNFTKNNQS